MAHIFAAAPVAVSALRNAPITKFLRFPRPTAGFFAKKTAIE
jgi:hypothetical protein